jgi:hypothetical protein
VNDDARTGGERVVAGVVAGVPIDSIGAAEARTAGTFRYGLLAGHGIRRPAWPAGRRLPMIGFSLGCYNPHKDPGGDYGLSTTALLGEVLGDQRALGKRHLSFGIKTRGMPDTP